MDDRIDDSQVKTRFILSDPRGGAHVKIKSGLVHKLYTLMLVETAWDINISALVEGHRTEHPEAQECRLMAMDCLLLVEDILLRNQALRHALIPVPVSYTHLTLPTTPYV